METCPTFAKSRSSPGSTTANLAILPIQPFCTILPSSELARLPFAQTRQIV